MNPDDRSPMAKAMGRVSQIITASVVLVLPAFGGNWLDLRYQTSPLFLLLGVLIGLVAAGWHFYKIIAALAKEE